MFLIRNQEEYRQYLKEKIKFSDRLRSVATKQKDKRYYDGMTAGLEEAMNGLDDWVSLTANDDALPSPLSDSE